VPDIPLDQVASDLATAERERNLASDSTLMFAKLCKARLWIEAEDARLQASAHFEACLDAMERAFRGIDGHG
jgi:hypothetical protein